MFKKYVILPGSCPVLPKTKHWKFDYQRSHDWVDLTTLKISNNEVERQFTEAIIDRHQLTMHSATHDNDDIKQNACKSIVYAL